MSKIEIGNPTIKCPKCETTWIEIKVQRGHPVCPECHNELDKMFVDKEKWETTGNLEPIKDQK